ncbi:MAG: TGS domain-containing protein, partial [Burkholderiaceae bacterium]
MDQAALAAPTEHRPVQITLPDGSVRTYERPVTGDELAHDISLSLAKAAVAIRIDGAMKDLGTVIDR